MYLMMVLVAAFAYTLGGMYMKLSKGLSELVPSLLVYFFLIAGASIEAIAMNGTVVQVGMGRLEATINTRTLILKKVSLKGSQGGDGDDIANVYKLMAEGNMDVDLTEIKFEEVAEGLERLHKGGVKGRLVAVQD